VTPQERKLYVPEHTMIPRYKGFQVCCLLPAACHLPSAICCLLSAVCSLPSAVYVPEHTMIPRYKGFPSQYKIFKIDFSI
jgi:hypothetical protein